MTILVKARLVAKLYIVPLVTAIVRIIANTPQNAVEEAVSIFAREMAICLLNFADVLRSKGAAAA